MRTFAYQIICVACIVELIGSVRLCFADDQVLRPTWNVGDSWTVKTWYPAVSNRARVGEPPTFVRKGMEVLVSFLVTAVKEVDGQSCYELEVVYPRAATQSQDRYLLYFRKEEKRLVRVVDHSLRTDGSVINSVKRFPIDDDGPTFVDTSYSGAVPFDFPDLNSRNSERTDLSNYMQRQAVTSRLAKGADGKEYTEHEFVLTRTSENRKYEEKTVLKWVNGEPWWRHAIGYRDISPERRSEYVSEAHLVEFTTDGERHVVKGRQDEE